MRSLRRLSLGLLGLVVLIAVAEGALRLVLGTPALSVGHPEIEYMFRPDQNVRRFGNRISINGYGMRSAPISEWPDRSSMRVAVFGDSVLNGGNLTDQGELATSLLDGQSARGGRTLEVLNISAGSWGPGNYLAYARHFGLFGPEYAVVVLSSHDIDDDRRPGGLDPRTHPEEAPVLVLAEFVDRYLQRYSPVKWSEAPEQAPRIRPEDARRALPELFALFRGAGVPFCVILHSSAVEMATPGLSEALRQIEAIAARFGGWTVRGREHLVPPQDYRDDLHLTAAGQRGLRDAIAACPGLSVPDG